MIIKSPCLGEIDVAKHEHHTIVPSNDVICVTVKQWYPLCFDHIAFCVTLNFYSIWIIIQNETYNGYKIIDNCIFL